MGNCNDYWICKKGTIVFYQQNYQTNYQQNYQQNNLYQNQQNNYQWLTTSHKKSPNGVDAKDRQLYVGRNGGEYYLTSSGNKVYSSSKCKKSL